MLSRATIRRSLVLTITVTSSFASWGCAVPSDSESVADELTTCGVLANGASPEAQTAVRKACSLIGTPYSWGGGHGSTPGLSYGACDPSNGAPNDCHVYGLDCSGMVRYAYSLATGADPIPGPAADQYQSNRAVVRYTRANGTSVLRPGDLVFFGDTAASLHHVAMYLGANTIVEAPYSGGYVRAVSMSIHGDYYGAIRLSKDAPSTPGDVDGDGRADLVTSYSDGSAYVYSGTASGAFGADNSSFAGTLDSALDDGAGHLFVGVADVTGDGHADLVSLGSSGSVNVFPGQSNLRFGDAVTSFHGTMTLARAQRAGHDPVALGDVTGDGRADLVTVNTDGNVYVYPGRSDGAFGDGVASFAGTFDNGFRDGDGLWIAGVADVTGDHHADLVAIHSNGNAYVYPGNANGKFSDATASFAGTMHLATIDGRGYIPVGVGDVTGDGHADLVTVHTNGNAYVYPGTSSGAFVGPVPSFAGTLSTNQFGGSGHQIIGVLDITGDGRADLVTQYAGNVYVYPGTSAGAFASGVASFGGTMRSSFLGGAGHEFVQMGPYPRRRVCAATGCRAR